MNTEFNKEKWLQKIYDTMKLGGKSDRTYENYKSHINRFLKNYSKNTSIKKLKEEDIVLYLKKNYLDLNRCESSINLAECAIKFLFSICFDKELNKKKLPCCKLRKKYPKILSKEMFVKIINEEKNIKHKCWLLFGYCSGLRVNEVANLKFEDLDFNEHKILVRDSKRRKDRFTLLPDVTIRIIKIYCEKKNIKSGYLFKGINGSEVINHNTIINYFSLLKSNYKLDNDISFHSLRHSFATYYIKSNGNLLTLQSMLGHSNICTTTIYLHLAQNFNCLEGVKYV